MFPRDFFLDYWNPAIRDQVFVAMPFVKQFDSIWTEAIQPAAKACGLSAFRVDVRKTSDSILVDILDGVANSRLILVDLSPVSCSPVGRLGVSRPQYPNGNVMYELGLAHASRQAEEVILVRNHSKTTLLFDVSGVRVHSYPGNDMTASRRIFEELMRDALVTVNRTKALQVTRAVQSISINDMKLIRKFWPHNFIMTANEPDGELSGLMSSLMWTTDNLQRLGILRASPLLKIEEFSVELIWTEFGHAVVNALGAGVTAGRPEPIKS